MLQGLKKFVFHSTGGRVDRASATEAVDSGSIPGRITQTKKLVFTASLLDVQQLKGQCEAPAVCGRLVAA